MTIYDCLTPWFCKTYNLQEDKEFMIEYVDPRCLLTAKRLDLAVKYKYVEAYMENKDMGFIKKVYKAHIEAFSEGRYVEPGQENEKKKIEDYFRTFNYLIESIRRNGFDEKKSVVPISRNNILCNGSHRVAIAMYLGCKVPCIRLSEVENITDYNYFYQRLMPERYIDYMALEYCTMRKNIFGGIIWPRGDKLLTDKKRINAMVKNDLAAAGDVVLTKKLKVSFGQCNEIVKQVYYPAPWLGSREDGFQGAQGKTKEVYDAEGNIRFFLIECPSLDKITAAKNKIRNYMGIGNHSIHTGDTYKETIHLIKVILGRYNYLTINELKRSMLRLRRNSRIKGLEGK